MPSAYQRVEALTNVVIAARPQGMIADMVLPRSDPMASTKFKYFKFADGQFFTLPDTRVGRKGAVNEVDFAGTEETLETADYGLSHSIPYPDQKAAPSTVDPEARAAEWLNNMILLDREVRTANIVFAPGTYGSNTQTLTSDDQFDNPDADLLNLIKEILDVPLMRPNKLVFGQTGWSGFRSNKSIVAAILGNAGNTGLVSRQAVADLFEVEEVIVGQGRINTAKPGQTPTFSRAWTDGFAAIYQDPIAVKVIGSGDGVPAATFGFTAQFDQRVAMRKEDDSIGLRGGVRIKVGESVKEVVCAPQFGYYLHNVHA